MSEAKAGNVAQEKMQKFGRFLSGMVMPNIGAFTAPAVGDAGDHQVAG